MTSHSANQKATPFQHQIMAATYAVQKTIGYQERPRTGALPQRFGVGATSLLGNHADGTTGSSLSPGYQVLTN